MVTAVASRSRAISERSKGTRLSARSFRIIKRQWPKLSDSAMTALSAAGIRGPVETALRQFMKESLNWKLRIIKQYDCGGKVIREVEKAAKELSIESGTKLKPRAAKILDSYKVETVEGLRQFVILEPDWRMTLKVTRGCGDATLQEIEDLAQNLGIL